MKNLKVLVTGGSQGIGDAIANIFYNNGFEIIILDIVPPANKSFKYHKCDIRNENEIVAALQNLNGLDILVNNAGIYLQKDVQDTEKDELDSIIDTNIKGTYLVTKHTLPHILKSKGNIINISSGIGIVPELSSPAYCMTKASIIMLTKVLAQKLAADGIRVNAVLPGPIDTPLLRKSFNNEKDFNEYKNLNPMKKIGTPQDVAEIVYFLASNKASFVTGGLYSVDGGESTSSIYSK